LKIYINVEKDNGETIYEGQFTSVDIATDNLYAFCRTSKVYKKENAEQIEKDSKVF